MAAEGYSGWETEREWVKGSAAFDPVADISPLWQKIRMSGIPETQQIALLPLWVRWLVPCAAGAFFARSIFRDGLTAYSIGSSAFALVWMLAAWFVFMRTRRPKQSFYAVGLASIMVAALFVVGPVVTGSAMTLGIIAWLGVTALALIWAAYYEQNQPSG